jgi:hypothetical protein
MSRYEYKHEACRTPRDATQNSTTHTNTKTPSHKHTGLNLYITAPGMKTSAPPHTDKQDVFVLQAQGSKHWRVYTPPPPANKMSADPYARGKGPDKLMLEELDSPVIDTVLQPGQLLYMPGMALVLCVCACDHVCVAPVQHTHSLCNSSAT